MSRNVATANADHPVLVCSIQARSAFKLDGDGGGSLTLHFDATQAQTIAELYLNYRETELHVPFIKVTT